MNPTDICTSSVTYYCYRRMAIYSEMRGDILKLPKDIPILYAEISIYSPMPVILQRK